MTFVKRIYYSRDSNRDMLDVYRAKGVKPYVTPLPYDLFSHKVENCVQFEKVLNSTNVGEVNSSMVSSMYANLYNNARVPGLILRNSYNGIHNRALDKVADELSYVKNMFEAWYERREAYSLLGAVGKELLQFTFNWNKKAYWKKLVSGSGQYVRRPRSLPEAWLLANFAIKPLIGTVDDCMNLLCSPFPKFWVEGSSGDSFSSFDRTSRLRYELTWSYVIKHGVEVTNINPNTQLLNIMGLTTPFSTFLNVVPWFWAVNYFVNINQMVSNLEVRFPGVVIGKTYTTVFFKGSWSAYEKYPDYRENGYLVKAPVSCYGRGVGASMKRTVGTKVPDYKLAVSYPALGSNQFANLFSALALSMKTAK